MEVHIMKKKLLTILVIIVATIVIANYKSIYAFFTTEDAKTNVFSVGNISATVTEPNYEDNKIVTPGAELVKDPTFSNTGKIDSYIRAQVYVPISKDIKYVDENENVVTPTEEVELVTYKLNDGWELVTDEGFSGIYEDTNGNKYKVYTYKYVENGKEKIVATGETIAKALFDKVKIINYLDIDQTINIKLQVSAIAVQSDGGTADEMWTYYKNQNTTAIVGLE
jgi:hypothetical protein